jgi:hypothetical protein
MLSFTRPQRGPVQPAALAVTAGIVAGLLGVAGAALPGRAAGELRSTASLQSKAPVPASLTEVESAAEDIVDLALANDRRGVIAKAATLEATASGSVATALMRAGVPSAKTTLLKKRAVRVAQLARAAPLVGVALAANAISELMPSFYGRFRGRVPGAIFMLDYLDREAQLRSLARQANRVKDAVAKLGRTWTQVRPTVVTAGGADEARVYGRHVAAMKRLLSRDNPELQAEAVRGLALVDDLENVFTR